MKFLSETINTILFFISPFNELLASNESRGVLIILGVLFIGGLITRKIINGDYPEIKKEMKVPTISLLWIGLTSLLYISNSEEPVEFWAVSTLMLMIVFFIRFIEGISLIFGFKKSTNPYRVQALALMCIYIFFILNETSFLKSSPYSIFLGTLHFVMLFLSLSGLWKFIDFADVSFSNKKVYYYVVAISFLMVQFFDFKVYMSRGKIFGILTYSIYIFSYPIGFFVGLLSKKWDKE